VQCVGGRADHARQHLDIFQFAHRCFGEDRLDRRAQAFFVDRAGEAAREPHSGLFERHDLEAMLTTTGRRKAGLPHCVSSIDNKRGPARRGHLQVPF
jgi:hypothetical protein